MGIALGFDDGKLFIPKCGYQKKDGSILLCDDCARALIERQSELSGIRLALEDELIWLVEVQHRELEFEHRFGHKLANSLTQARLTHVKELLKQLEAAA